MHWQLRLRHLHALHFGHFWLSVALVAASIEARFAGISTRHDIFEHGLWDLFGLVL